VLKPRNNILKNISEIRKGSHLLQFSNLVWQK